MARLIRAAMKRAVTTWRDFGPSSSSRRTSALSHEESTATVDSVRGVTRSDEHLIGLHSIVSLHRVCGLSETDLILNSRRLYGNQCSRPDSPDVFSSPVLRSEVSNLDE